MVGKDSSSIHRLRTKILVLWLTIGAFILIPDAVHAIESNVTYQDTVGPIACIRYFENSTLCIGVKIVNTWSTPIKIIGNLTFPDSFIDCLKNSNTTEMPYYTLGIKGVIGNCSFIQGNQSEVSIFSFHTNGSFMESEYYNLELQ